MCGVVSGCLHFSQSVKNLPLVLQIVSSELCNYQQTVCIFMAALNGPSKVVVDVRNAGALTTTYTVTLGSCTYPIAAVPPQSVTLTPGQTSEVVLQVFSERIILFFALLCESFMSYSAAESTLVCESCSSKFSCISASNHQFGA